MSKGLSEVMRSWHLCPDSDDGVRIDALLEPLYARGVLSDEHESVDAMLLDERYHLGGVEDTRRMGNGRVVAVEE